MNTWLTDDQIIILSPKIVGNFTYQWKAKKINIPNCKEGKLTLTPPICLPELWGIVNNAGICYIGNVEMMTMEDMQKIMAVNYFGPVNVCKAFLPLLRRSRGRLVNIASNAGM